jgi:hypothetical protein
MRKKFSIGEMFEKEGKKVGTSESRKVGKDKRSFSIEKNVVDDLEILAWYTEKSASQVVEEALKQYLSNNEKLLGKAKEIKRSKE